MVDFGLPREEFMHQRKVMQGLPDGRERDLAVFDIVAPDYVVEDRDHPLAGLPPECIAEAVDLLTASALGYSAYWASMSAEETARRTK